jgi:N-formylglutamate amidohydrolase
MTAWQPLTTTRADDAAGAAFGLARPDPAVAATPLVFASPHSGRVYPPGLMAASRLDALAIRRSEDAHVDTLIATAPAHGASVIAARLARVWLDVNREPWELDPDMFEDELPAYARSRTARVAAGLGSIARVIGEGEEIYRRKLAFAEALARVETVHRPYHAALAGLVAETRRMRGLCVLIDWHSMPSAASGRRCGGAGWDMVLGDRFGAACAPTVARLAEETLRSLGYRVARNMPYAGGYTTAHYGRPEQRVHALQIEINRAIYMDERTLAPTDGFATLHANLEAFFADLAAEDWSRIQG